MVQRTQPSPPHRSAGPHGVVPRPRGTHRHRRRRLAALAAATLALGTAPTATATTVPGPGPEVVVDGLTGPLSVTATRSGVVLVAQSFAGVVTRVDARGRRTDVLARPGEELAGVTATGTGFLSTRSLGEGPDATALVERTDRRGTTTTLVDLAAHERATDPDSGTTFGLLGLDDACAAQVPEGIPLAYTGETYSHPYATADLGSGRTAVADAGGNAVHVVTYRGRVRASVPLPAQEHVLTADEVAAVGLPSCAAGATYAFEPVPTDVEVGPDGDLYVTLLPGGPEDGTLGDRGSVVRLDMDDVLSGHEDTAVETVLAGLAAPTGLAVDEDGALYVAQLGGQVRRYAAGSPEGTEVLAGAPAGDVDLVGGRLYVATDVFTPGGGSVVRLDVS